MASLGKSDTIHGSCGVGFPGFMLVLGACSFADSLGASLGAMNRANLPDIDQHI